MLNEVRTVCFDTELGIEAYNFKGIMQKFPNHFHDYYVIGFIENGKRYLSCKNKQYIIETGDLIVFNPGDIHTCEQIDNRTLDYRCINIKKDVMKKITFEITGKEYLPNFMEFVLFRNELTSSLKELHLMIMEEEKDLKKEELFLFIIEQLIREYSNPVSEMTIQEASAEIKTVCDYLENNYMENITLNQLSNLTGLSKYYLLHSFTKQKGISPYNYLQTIRIGKAKKMLEQGIAPIDVAFKTGFTDQSHFTNFFKKLIGLTPKQYMNIFINRCRSKENE
ncbi:AraC family ligand binding domain-containing protein [Clostridium beijerinckii]|jgi:transcriptional regulator, AraC family|uniref:AraC family transcriptional regulator n=2 Tax=Clostridium beijerinckii TaxID=1520 RepID=A0AAE2V2Y8_CLOBE|nr:AraC family transcriptional regulator [Clostridium beijerinckii]ABR35561.1 transcriptional regulator, AraC family [Clostridium beijerinckii NCIMB 8052]AIU02483.1 AraC family transcriptional regulator [Clostridium beijerinckii ATCC 35702]MBF7809801.1 AraC family transcriptional regulator [Clostridium beijerinckii]NRT69416.1 AraC-like DNA-binding protein [Clostridium beijerinckii]NRT84436.1 AraC-like DNA-binding protein [Clostridium beijerinckii]